uniref:Uncharacterized protein n=1 Tax=viral metagenome TaxID=1070528 RepID=A0A6H1ZP27_9ZZZZ
MGEGVFLWAWDGTVWRKVLIDANGKLQVDVASGLDVDVNLHGYDGAAWQPIRGQVPPNFISWNNFMLLVAAGQYRYDAVFAGWTRVPSKVTPKRMTAAGQVVAGAHNLYWLSINPSAAAAAVDITDDLTGLGAIVFDMYRATRDHMHIVLEPPMPFSTGIYLKTFTNLTSVMFGYV